MNTSGCDEVVAGAPEKVEAEMAIPVFVAAEEEEAVLHAPGDGRLW